MEKIEQEIADEYLDHLILDTTNGSFLWGDLARLDELAHLGEKIFIPRTCKIFYLISMKKFVMSLEKDKVVLSF